MGGAEPANLEQLLDRFCSAERGRSTTTVGAIVAEVGTRSFGPLLLLAGAILTSPISGIPGVPTSMGVLVLLISAQLLLRRDHFWLPQWILRRRIRRSRIEALARWLRRPARWVDKFLRPRWTRLVSGRLIYVIGSVCFILALAVPIMEVVPFSASLAGVAFTAFGVALTARDGAVAAVAFVAAGSVAGLLTYSLIV